MHMSMAINSDKSVFLHTKDGSAVRKVFTQIRKYFKKTK